MGKRYPHNRSNSRQTSTNKRKYDRTSNYERYRCDSNGRATYKAILYATRPKSKKRTRVIITEFTSDDDDKTLSKHNDHPDKTNVKNDRSRSEQSNSVDRGKKKSSNDDKRKLAMIKATERTKSESDLDEYLLARKSLINTDKAVNALKINACDIKSILMKSNRALQTINGAFIDHSDKRVNMIKAP